MSLGCVFCPLGFFLELPVIGHVGLLKSRFLTPRITKAVTSEAAAKVKKVRKAVI